MPGGEYAAHEINAPKGSGWGKVMELANRKVEEYDCYVQVWNGGMGDGTYTTALGTQPINMD